MNNVGDVVFRFSFTLTHFAWSAFPR